jgi:addiction module RelE/StbE family toxin
VTIRWTERAAYHLESIYDFIARDNPDAALEVIEGLYASIERLRTYPNLGRAAELDTRKLVQPPYVIMYRVVEDVVSIEAVFHGSRRF